MPDPKQGQLSQKQPDPSSGAKPPMNQGQNKKTITPPKDRPKPKTLAQEKDDAFKYEMQYANGGFNNGVEIKPDKDGKAQLKVSIYGGGEQKVMLISPLPGSITKLINAYALTASQSDDPTPEITTELQKYFDEVRNVLSAKMIQIVTDADNSIKAAINDAFKEVNKRY